MKPRGRKAGRAAAAVAVLGLGTLGLPEGRCLGLRPATAALAQANPAFAGLSAGRRPGRAAPAAVARTAAEEEGDFFRPFRDALGSKEATLETQVKELSGQEALLKEKLEEQGKRAEEVEAKLETQVKELSDQEALLKQQLEEQGKRAKELEVALKEERQARERLEKALAEERVGKEELLSQAVILQEAFEKLTVKMEEAEASESKLAEERDVVLKDLEAARLKIEQLSEEVSLREGELEEAKEKAEKSRGAFSRALSSFKGMLR